MTFYPVNLVGNAALSNPVTVAQGGTGLTASPITVALGGTGLTSSPLTVALGGTNSIVATGGGVSGQNLIAPVVYAPASQINLSLASATMGLPAIAATTVAAGSNGGEISLVGSWSSPSAGVLDVATVTGWPTAGTFTVATSTTTATCTYTGTAAGMLTGVAYVSGSATGTVSTGGAVTLISAVLSTGAFTAPASGSVLISVCFAAQNSSAGAVNALGFAAHGTVTPILGNATIFKDSAASNTRVYQITQVINSLTGSNNLDLVVAASAGTLQFQTLGTTSTTPTGTVGSPIIITVSAV